MQSLPLNRRHIFLLVGGLFLLLVLIYGRSLFHDFVFWDDPDLILDNPFIRGVTPENVVYAFTHYDPDLYVPLTFLSFQLNYLIGGLEPFIYHLTNLLLHVGSSLLVGWIALRLSGRKSVALLTALLFAVHPVNVEAVAWVSARKDVLSGFFFLASLGSFLQWRSGGDRRWYAAALGAFLCGLLSKVSILGLPVILLLADWYETKTLRWRSLLASAPFFLLSVLFGYVALFGKLGGTFPLWAKLLVGMQAAMFSLWHLVWPFDYALIYPFAGTASLARWDLLLPLLLIIFVSAATVLLRKRFPTPFLAWWWYLILLAPSFLTAEKGSDLVAQLYLTSDRYVYVAAIGVFLLAAKAVEILRRRSERPAVAAAGIVLIGFAVIAFFQSLVWENTETLLRHALARNPESAIAHNNLGVFFDAQGDTDAAFREYEEAARAGASSDAWFNYGMALQKRGKHAEAIAALLKAVELRPDFVAAQMNLGAFLLDAGEIQASVDHLLAAQKLDPRNLTVFLNLGLALEKGGNLIDARRAYEEALEIDPQNAFAQEQLRKMGTR